MFLRKIATVVALTTLASSAWAGCGISEGRVSIVGNEFPAIQTIGAGAMECAGDGVTVETNLTADHQKINVAGMSGNPAEYTSAIVANSSIVALINNDVIRPLNDLVEKHGQGLQKSQLVTIDGNIMGIAFMANAAHPNQLFKEAYGVDQEACERIEILVLNEKKNVKIDKYES